LKYKIIRKNTNYIHNYRRLYAKNNNIEEGKVKLIDGKLITQVNLAFKSPSAPADMITGLSENGWKFFKGLEEIRSSVNKR
jgi:hypothetical protein